MALPEQATASSVLEHSFVVVYLNISISFYFILIIRTSDIKLVSQPFWIVTPYSKAVYSWGVLHVNEL